MTLTSDWTTLLAGELIAVRSLSGNRYQGVHLGGTPAGVFLRMEGRGIVRLGLDRIDTETLEVLGPGSPLVRDDEVLLQPRGGVELRGRVEEADAERVVLQVSRRGPVAVALAEVVPQSAFLLFRAASLRVGDDFLLSSRSGRPYRGVVAELTSRYLVARLRQSGEEVRMRVNEIDLRSVEVLIPLRLTHSSEL